MTKQEIIHLVLSEIEGPISDDPEDPGGRTAWGITERWHPELFADGDPSFEKAVEVATVEYWDRARLNEIESVKIAGEMFEFAFNAGMGDAVTIVQEAFNDLRLPEWLALKVDGLIGIKTITQVNRMARRYHASLYNAMNCGQGMWYRKNAKRRFRRGLVAKRISSETGS